MYNDLVKYLEGQSDYLDRQNVMLYNKDHLTSDDYKWIAKNNAQISEFDKWIRMLENAGKSE